jgi:hypothetical protein
MTSQRKKAGVVFWATVTVVVLVGYPLSFGPACWLLRKGWLSTGITAEIYRPLIRVANSSAPKIHQNVADYSGRSPFGFGATMLDCLTMQLDEDFGFL